MQARSILSGAAAFAATALILTGCAGADAGAGAGTESEDTAPVATAEPTAGAEIDDRQDVAVSVVGANYDADATSLEVRAVVTGYIGEGTCTMTVSIDGAEDVTATVESTPDAQSTVCPSTLLEGVESDDWTLVVAFENDDAVGESEPVTSEEFE